MSNEDLNISASLAEMSDVSFDTPIRQAILGDTFWRTPTRPEQQLQHHQQTANNTTTTSMTPTSQTCHSIAGQSESRIWTGLKSSATNSSAEQPSSDHHQLLTSRVQAQQACSSTSLTTKANTAPQNQKFQYLNTANHSVAAILKGESMIHQCICLCVGVVVDWMVNIYIYHYLLIVFKYLCKLNPTPWMLGLLLLKVSLLSVEPVKVLLLCKSYKTSTYCS